MSQRLLHHVEVPPHEPGSLVKRASLEDLWKQLLGTTLDIEGYAPSSRSGGLHFRDLELAEIAPFAVRRVAGGLSVWPGLVKNLYWSETGNTTNMPHIGGVRLDAADPPLLDAEHAGDGVIAVELQVRFNHGPVPSIPYDIDAELLARPEVKWLDEIAVSIAVLAEGDDTSDGVFAYPIAALRSGRFFPLVTHDIDVRPRVTSLC